MPQPAQRLSGLLGLRGYAPALFAVVVGVSISITLCLLARRWEESQVHTAFERRAATLTGALDKSINEHLEVLRTINALKELASPTTTPNSDDTLANVLNPGDAPQRIFGDYVRQTLTRRAGLYTFIYLPRVPGVGRAAVETAIASLSGSEIVPLREDTNAGLVPASQRDEYFPVLIAFPPETGAAMLGVDFGANPAAREAFFRARDSGDLTMTTPMTFSWSATSEQYVLMVLPLWGSGRPNGTAAERRENFLGALVGVVRTQELLAGAIDDLENETIDVALYDASGAGEPMLLARSTPQTRAPTTASVSDDAAAGSADGLHWSAPLNVTDRQWRVDFSTTSGYKTEDRSLLSWSLLLGGLLSTTLLTAYLWTMTGRRAKVEQLVAEQTADLRVANAALADEVKERTAAEAARRASEERLRAQFDGLPIPTYIWQRCDNDFVLMEDNAAAQAATEGRLAAVLDKRAGDSLDAIPNFRETLSRCLEEGKTLTTEAVLAIGPQNEQRDLVVTFVPVPPDLVMVHTEDVTARRRFEAQLEHLAFHDPLTGLPNRALFRAELSARLARQVNGTATVAVLFLDLDGFKVINDSLGHGAGDALLVAVADRLQGCVRHNDLVARLGGDEFVILVECSEGSAFPEELAARILTSLQQPIRCTGRDVVASASIGIAVSSSDGQAADPDEMVRHADIALYQAKAAGKSRAIVFERAMNASAVARLDRETALRRAIEQGELRVYYQPIIDLASGTAVGCEALLRWQDPEQGLIKPGQFIAIAEETGLIVPIDAWVLEEACRQVRQWDEHCPDAPPMVVSVNLSARRFAQADLVEQVAGVLARTGLPAHRLVLEITETVFMADTRAAVAIVEELHNLGVRFALDDFGTGYSSLSYLRTLPVEILKVDRSFVQELGTESSAQVIVEAVATMAHALGMVVTAEGIETAAHLSNVRAAGSDYGQGYRFARPMPAAAMTAWLRSRAAGGTHDGLLVG
jgi:diguanylate cyclase (GGDEF)-like protein